MPASILFPDRTAASSFASRPHTRDEVLAALLDPDRLPTPPAVALQVVQAASRKNCNQAEIVALLNRDPALCAKLLKAVNSCVYGLAKPVASVARAVGVLGLNAVRSLSLGLSLPAMRAGRGADRGMRDYWIGSVGGAIIARELAARTRRPCPEDDMVAGLLRDLGSVLLRQAFPDGWADLTTRHADRLFAERCEAEEEVFGISHADVTAELLRGWNLPEEIIEPIRHHHHPERLAGGRPVLVERAKLLYFAGLLTNLDQVVRTPEVLDYVLTVARDCFNLPRPDLTDFLQGVVPKITEFGRLIDQDVGECPDFAAILSAGAEELVNLTVDSNRTRLSGSVTVALIRRPGAAAPPPVIDYDEPGAGPPVAAELAGLPEFRPAFIDDFPAGGCRLGGYALQEQLGRGAMGAVYKAFEPSLGRFVAVKLMTPAVAAQPLARQRFAREARLVAAIRHENVVAIHAVKEAAGLPYLAMEYVDGASLEDHLTEHGPPTVRVIARVGRQIAAGLAAAHALNIVHRDIKPANVLLERATDRVKITDFGLARGVDDGKLSQDGSLIGTPYFMSPEQVLGEPVGPRSDLFSLGGLLYVLCTGLQPFPGDNIATVLRGVCDGHPESPRRIRPTLPTWLDALVMKLLCKNPAGRYTSAAEVAAALAERAGV